MTTDQTGAPDAQHRPETDPPPAECAGAPAPYRQETP